ncbi:MAG: adenylate/guanylate cyclase domain-containing protein [Deltaproteobacteria bacterium]|nr:adenylate/guanylate cyclase domain-containing protein [Deltaproteobacteria bacterium]
MADKKKSKELIDRILSHPTAVFFLIGVIVVIFSVVLFAVKPNLLTRIDLQFSDVMFKVRGPVAPPEDVVIVAVDEKSINEVGRWPWNRTKTAELIDGLNEASAVGLDIVFSEPQLPSPGCLDEGSDAALAASIRKAGNVVLGYYFRDDSTEEPSKLALDKLSDAKVKITRRVDGSKSEQGGAVAMVKKSTGVELNIEPILEAGAAGQGSFNVTPGTDGVLRTANLVIGYKEGMYPVLSMEALKVYLGEQIIVNEGEYGVDSLNIGEAYIPTDEQGRFLLNYYGPGGTIKTYSAADVMNKRLPPGTFKDKVVFIGITEIGIYDIRVTPMDPVFPGVEMHATVVGNVMEGNFIVKDAVTAFFTFLGILFLPLILAFVISRTHRTYVTLAAFAVLFLVSSVVAYMLFAKAGMMVSLFYPLVSLSLAYVSMEAYRNLVVEGKSKFYKKAFSTYVPPQLVSEIIKNPEKLKLGGEKKIISVLFSDIRGFTTMSESLEPQRLVALLNSYLTPMTEIVFKEQGTLDKYIGDAIMAIFNAPVDVVDHPRRACTTAVTMIRALPKLNEGWKTAGFPPVDIGIGINTGEAVVGNMGADLRFDYTAIGDTVNLASRLEGMTKQYGVKIIVNESTYSACKEDFVFRLIDLVRVKGKNEPAAVYELMGLTTEMEKYAALSTAFRDAYVDYRKGKFKTAKAAFEAILAKYPSDGPSLTYIKRCDEFIATPPPPGWDGVYVSKTK